VGQLDFYRARLGAINSDQESWAKVSSLILDGATYEVFVATSQAAMQSGGSAGLPSSRMDHRTSDFKPQPYEQLAKVLRSMGHETEAKEILIEKRKLQRQVRWKYPEHYPRPKAIWPKPFWYLAHMLGLVPRNGSSATATSRSGRSRHWSASCWSVGGSTHHAASTTA
jgi:hypothetical protein